MPRIACHPSPRTRSAFAALVVLVMSAALAVSSAPAASAQGSDVQGMLDLTNQSRADNGLAPLQYDDALSGVARGWVSQIASDGALSHNPNLASQISSQVTDDWTRIGENVGYGWTLSSLQDAFMNSPGHRANILGDYQRVGIATLRDANGAIWVVLDFLKASGGAAPPVTTASAPPPPPPPPVGSTIGSLDSSWRQPGSIGVYGWTIDPDNTAATPVHIYVDGQIAALGTADVERPDIAAAYPGYGANHGFMVAVPVSGGAHKICAYGINSAGDGTNTELGCVDVNVADSPMGALDTVRMQTDGIRAIGWSVDPDTADSTKVHFYIDGKWAGMTDANRPRADVGALVPSYGANHGYDFSMAVASGNHIVCAYGINTAAGGSNTMLGCRYFVISGDPSGSLDDVISPQAGKARVTGWTFDPDADRATTTIHVYVDNGFGGVFQADTVRNDTGAAFPDAGNNHGYDVTLNLAVGTHMVCAYAINTAGVGDNSLLGCHSVTVS
jgi:uncharacterized protein YkwD